MSITISEKLEEVAEQSDRNSKMVNSHKAVFDELLKNPDMCTRLAEMLKSSQGAASRAPILETEKNTDDLQGEIYMNYHTSNLLIISMRTNKND